MERNEVSRQEFDALKEKVNKLEKIFDKISDIAISTEKLAIEIKYIREEQNKMDVRQSKVEGDIAEIKEKPAKRYDSIVTYIITTIVGAIIGAIITLIKK